MYAFDYKRASSVTDAASLAGQNADAKILAGGQTLVATLKQRLAKPGVKDLLAAFAAAVETVEPFEPATLEAALKGVVERAGVKVGDLVHAVRVAVTGKTVGPGLYDCLAILGRETSLARLARALPRCG